MQDYFSSCSSSKREERLKALSIGHAFSCTRSNRSLIILYNINFYSPAIPTRANRTKKQVDTVLYYVFILPLKFYEMY